MADTTDFRIKTEILADLWMDYRDDEAFKDFVEYNDLGLPLAYAISNGIVDTSPMAEQFLNESFRLLLASLGIEDEGFENLTDVLTLAENKSE
jgi:hypothetical protein